MNSSCTKGFAKRCIDTGTVLLSFVFLEEIRVRSGSMNSHAIFLNAVLGSGKEGGRLLLWLLSASQVCSCGTLLVPPLYKKLGTSVPSMALGMTLLAEFLLYRGYADAEVACRSLLMWASLFMVALFRGDTRAREAALGAPVVAKTLAVAAMIRHRCTRLHTAVALPPVSGVVALRAVWCSWYWGLSGPEYELRRAAFSLAVSQCAVMALLAGQDRSENYFIVDTIREKAAAAALSAARAARHRIYKDGLATKKL